MTTLTDLLTEAGITDTPTGTGGGDRVLTIECRSTQTKRAILDAMSPEQRARRIQQLAAFPEDLDEHDTTTVRVAAYKAPTETPFYRWVADAARKIPADYEPTAVYWGDLGWMRR